MKRKSLPVLSGISPRRAGEFRRRFRGQWLRLVLAAMWVCGFSPVLAQTSFGPVNISSTSTSTVTVKVAQAGTVARIDALTKGSPNLDFSAAGGGTCSTGTAYAAGATCTVSVDFKPQYAGSRIGAVVLSDASGNVLANTYLQGTGFGAQIGYVAIGLSSRFPPVSCGPNGVALDGAGNFYVTCAITTGGSGAVFKEVPTGDHFVETQISAPPGSTFQMPEGIAVDGAGNVFFADSTGKRIVKLTPSANGYAQTTLPIGGLMSPMGIAVDTTGNLFITDYDGHTLIKVDLADGSYSQTTLLSGLYQPKSVAVDASGDVFVVAGQGCGNGVCMLVPSGTSYLQKTLGQNLKGIRSVAVDGVGNVYIGETDNIVKETLVNGTYVEGRMFVSDNSTWPLVTGFGFAIDGPGNLWFDSFAGGAEVNQASIAPGPSFESTLGVESASQAIGITNLGNMPLQVDNVTFPADFKTAAQVTSPFGFPPDNPPIGECTAVGAVPVGDICTVSLSFLPFANLNGQVFQELDESLLVATNSQAGSGSPQSVPIRGTEERPITSVIFTSSADPSVVGQPVTLTMRVPGTLVPPTGTFSLYSGEQGVMNWPVVGTFDLDHNGQATYTLPSLPVGSTSYSVSYSGDGNYQAGMSAIITQNVIPGPGVSDFGNPNMGTVNVGSSSNISSLDITFIGNDTLGGIEVLTQGAPNLDFQDAGAGTCVTGHLYSAGSHCSVNVVFKPRLPGPRYGGVRLTDGSGNVIGTGYLLGAGVGPLPVFPPGVLSTISADFVYPKGLSIDASGNIYYADYQVYKLAPAKDGYTKTTVATGFSHAVDVVIDGSGNLYVVDVGGGGATPGIYKLTPSNGSYARTPIGDGKDQPASIAVDGVGNIYFPSLLSIIKETPSAGSYAQSTISGPWTVSPNSVAVDGSGNLYVIESSIVNGTVYKLTLANGNYTTSTIGSGWINPISVTVDAGGNVYVVDYATGGTPYVAKATPQPDGTYTVSKLSTGLTQPEAVAVDGGGNVYISAFDSPPAIRKLTVSASPSLSFAATARGATSSDSPQKVTVANAGTAPLNFSAITYPADFPQHGGATGDCSAGTGTALAPGASCTFSVDFTPMQSGTVGTSVPLSETVSVTSPSSGPGSGFAIGVAGTENIVAAPAFTVVGNSVAVSRGATTGNTAAITISPSGGFTGAVALSAALTASPAGAQYPPTFSFGSASTVTVSGAAGVTATLTISTTAASVSALRRPGSFYAGAAGAMACCLVLAGTLRRRRWSMLSMFALGLLLSGGIMACGGGGGGGGGGGVGISGTTPGSYTITVTGTSGSNTATGIVNLTVR